MTPFNAVDLCWTARVVRYGVILSMDLSECPAAKGIYSRDIFKFIATSAFLRQPGFLDITLHIIQTLALL